MHSTAVDAHEHHHDADSTDVYGFWLYIMTDCLLFTCLFATYVVLNKPYTPGTTLKGYLNLRDILIETFLLLGSNFTFCLAILNIYKEKISHVSGWLLATFILGAGFVFMEVREFAHLAHEGFSWTLNGHASSFFTLVGTHGLHVTVGLIWIAIMMFSIPFIGVTNAVKRKMTYLGLFWNFLDIVWIFVFTIVYLHGAL